MKNTIGSGLRQAAGIRLVMGIFAMVAVVFLSSVDSLVKTFRETALLPYGYHTDFILTALQSDTAESFLPILAVLPFAGSYVDDIKSKFVRFFLIRTNYNAYLISRTLVCFLCGGFVIAAGTAFAWGISTLIFLPMEKAAEVPPESTALLLKACGLLILNGGLWAVMGIAMSTLMESKYIAYASPFVVYYLLVILYERYFSNCFLIYPREWINPSNLWPFGAWGSAILMMELTLAFALLFVFRAGRRLREL